MSHRSAESLIHHSGCGMNKIVGFVRSKSGRMLIVFLVLTAGISAAVANYVYHSGFENLFRREGHRKGHGAASGRRLRHNLLAFFVPSLGKTRPCQPLFVPTRSKTSTRNWAQTARWCCVGSGARDGKSPRRQPTARWLRSLKNCPRRPIENPNRSSRSSITNGCCERSIHPWPPSRAA